MSKRLFLLILSFFILSLMAFSIIALYNSDKYKIETIEISVNEGSVPLSTITEVEKYKGENLIFLERKYIISTLLNNPLIESIQIKREFPKKMRIYLIKSQVNAIMKITDGNQILWNILVGNKILPIVEADLKSLGGNIITVECNSETAQILNDNLLRDNKKLFLESIRVINNNSYLISNIKYDNNVKNNSGVFEITLKDLKTVLRFKKGLDEEIFVNSFNLANQLFDGEIKEQKTILDIYHGTVVERQ